MNNSNNIIGLYIIIWKLCEPISLKETDNMQECISIIRVIGKFIV